MKFGTDAIGLAGCRLDERTSAALNAETSSLEVDHDETYDTLLYCSEEHPTQSSRKLSASNSLSRASISVCTTPERIGDQLFSSSNVSHRQLHERTNELSPSEFRVTRTLLISPNLSDLTQSKSSNDRLSILWWVLDQFCAVRQNQIHWFSTIRVKVSTWHWIDDFEWLWTQISIPVQYRWTPGFSQQLSL